MPEQKADLPRAVAKQEGLARVEKIPISVNDLRDPSACSFDLDKFLTMISRLRSEELYGLHREYDQSDYGKYMSIFASSESDHWDEAIQSAKAIEITLSTPQSHGFEFLEGK